LEKAIAAAHPFTVLLISTNPRSFRDCRRLAPSGSPVAPTILTWALQDYIHHPDFLPPIIVRALVLRRPGRFLCELPDERIASAATRTAW